MKKELPIAMAIAKKNKKQKMAEGGKIKLSSDHEKNAHLYADTDNGSKQGAKVRSANRSKSFAKSPHSSSPSIERSMAKDRMSEARDVAAKRLQETQSSPKPKLQGLARGGMVESSLIKAHPLDAIGQILKEHEAHLESQLPPEDETEHMDYNDEHALHSKQMAEGGEVDEYGYPIKHPTPAPRLDAIKPAAPKPMQPKEKSIYDYAEGGEVMDEDEDMADEAEDEDHASIAAAIMAKRSKFAEGGAVDIDENAEEQSNMYYKLNKAALKENYDSDMDDVSQPEDSNEESDSIESDDHDKISVMRRKMALKRMAK